MIKSNKIQSKISGLYKELAEITGNAVWCRTCKKRQGINPVHCFKYGWPEHCGHTMTIDHPSKW